MLLSASNTYTKTGRVPLITDFGVTADVNAYPFLVSTTKAYRWVWQPPVGPLRVGVRQSLEEDPPWAQIIAAVIAASRTYLWGADHPLSEAGVAACIQHVREYGVSDYDVVAADPILGAAVESWVPKDCVLVIPKNRALLGTINVFPKGGYSFVVENPSRAMGIAFG
jgi:hypothetical protein